MNTACTKVQFTLMLGIASNQEEMKCYSCSVFPEALEGYQRYYRQPFNLSQIKHARIKEWDTNNGDSFFTYMDLERTRAWPRKCLSLIEKRGTFHKLFVNQAQLQHCISWRDLRFFSSLSHSFLSFYPLIGRLQNLLSDLKGERNLEILDTCASIFKTLLISSEPVMTHSQV